MSCPPLDTRLSGSDDKNTDREGGLVVKERVKTKKPKMWKVLVHNDDYTTMEFVVWVLVTVFHHSPEEAARIMLHVHQNGVGVAGVFTREIAETKTRKVVELARAHQFPLQATTEEAS
jgi:ATP-dependent Clp protease adaptor protein ClpS